MANQQKILPMGCLHGVTVDIDGASTQTDFEVIKIVDDSNPYPPLLGIDWVTNMNGVIDLKKRKIIFKNKSLCMMVLLDPTEWLRYTEPMRDADSDDELDCIYQITVQDQDRVNLTVDGRLSWDDDSSCTSDSDEEVERWQNWLHEVTMLNCNRMVIVGIEELLKRFMKILRVATAPRQRVTPEMWTTGHKCQRKVCAWMHFSPAMATSV